MAICAVRLPRLLGEGALLIGNYKAQKTAVIPLKKNNLKFIHAFDLQL
jgi:hypothetical protein